MTLRETNANALDDMRRRLVRLGVTGAPAATFTVFLDVDAERRRQTVIEQLRADPRCLLSAAIRLAALATRQHRPSGESSLSRHSIEGHNRANPVNLLLSRMRVAGGGVMGRHPILLAMARRGSHLVPDRGDFASV